MDKWVLFLVLLVAAMLAELRAEELRKVHGRYALATLDRATVRAAFSAHRPCVRSFGLGVCESRTLGSAARTRPYTVAAQR